MASRMMASMAILLSLNLFFSIVSSSHYVPCPPPPFKPKPHPHPTPKPAVPSCPRDTLKLGVCANVLKGLININIGAPPKEPCCTLLQGLTDVEAAVCLCTSIKAGVLGIILNLDVDLSLLLNYCGKKLPYGYRCA